MKRLTLLIAMLVMTMAITVPAVAQTGQDLPNSGSDGANLLTLGIGVFLIASGLLVRRIFGKS